MNDDQLRAKLRALPREIAPPRDAWTAIAGRVAGSSSGEDSDPESKPPFALRRVVLRGLSLAATVVLAFSALYLFKGKTLPDSGWEVSVIDGSEQPFLLREGAELTAADGIRYRASTWIGDVTIESGSTVRLAESGEEKQVFRLDRGEIYARIDAPPRYFIVETPSVTAIDLGCEYRLQIDDAGDGTLEVVSGWVALEFLGREWFVPAGASSTFDHESGPQPPVFMDASADFRELLRRFRGGASEVLPSLLDSARAFDTLTLWHLAYTADRVTRAAIYDAFVALNAVPADYAKEDYVDGNPAAVDWLRLHMGESVWFRPELFFESNLEVTP